MLKLLIIALLLYIIFNSSDDTRRYATLCFSAIKRVCVDRLKKELEQEKAYNDATHNSR